MRCDKCKTKIEKRTSNQNNALWLYFTLVAESLNDAGYTVQIVLKEKIDLDWNKDLVSSLLWKPAQQALIGEKSTTKLKKLEDIDTIFEHLNRHISEKFGIAVPFPSQEHLESIDENFISNR